MDPPDHTRLRGLVARAFTPRRIEELRHATATIAKELVYGLKVRGPDVDLIEAFAYPLPVRVICALLGVPAVDEAIFTEWSRAIARSLDPSVLRSPETDAKIEAARGELRAYLADLLAARRKLPGNDLLSALAAVDVDGDRITSGEGAVARRAAAGRRPRDHRQPDRQRHARAPARTRRARCALRQLPPRADRSLAGRRAAALRRQSVQITQRVVVEDMEVVGCPVKAGDEILLILGAANRDPSVFADPHTLDVTRDARRHVALGGGIHHCLGAALARMEGQIAFQALLDHFSRIELGGIPVWRPTFTLRGLESLPVKLTAAT